MSNINVNIENVQNNEPVFKLIDGLTIEKIRIKYNWILNADIENAIIGQDSYGLVWYKGIWKDGTWYDGTWLSGQFLNGRWKNGNFYSQTIVYNKKNNSLSVVAKDDPYQSHFKNGKWYGGNFYSGIFGSTVLSNEIILNSKTNFNDIYWNFKKYNIITGSTHKFYENYTTEVVVPTWISGNFWNGIISNSIWNGGNFYDGIFFNSVWNSGNFWNGKFLDRWWLGGNLYGGDFSNGLWLDGIFSKNINTISRFGTNLVGVKFEDVRFSDQIFETDWCFSSVVTNDTNGNNGFDIITSPADKLKLTNGFITCAITDTGSTIKTLILDSFKTEGGLNLSDLMSNDSKIESINVEINRKSSRNSIVNDNISYYINIDGSYKFIKNTSIKWYDYFHSKNYIIIPHTGLTTDVLLNQFKLFYNVAFNNSAIVGDDLNINYIRIKLNYRQVLPKSNICSWYGGKFNNGEMYSGLDNKDDRITTVYNGEWNNGSFYNGNMYNITWNDGNFYNGLMKNCTFNNGTIHNCIFSGSTFNNGDFYNGMILNSTITGGNISD